MTTEAKTRNLTGPISAAIACDRLRALQSTRRARRGKIEIQLKDFDRAEIAKEVAIRNRVPDTERGVLDKMLAAFADEKVAAE